MRFYLGYCGPNRVLQQLNKQCFENGLYPPRNFPVTCSFVVLPRLTRTIWKPAKPKIGMNSSEIMHIITSDTTMSGWKISYNYFKNRKSTLLQSFNLTRLTSNIWTLAYPCKLLLIMDDMNQSQNKYGRHVNWQGY